MRIGDFEKPSFFESAILDFFFQKKLFLLHPYENQLTVVGQQGWVKILMITLVSRPKQPITTNMHTAVCSTLDISKICFFLIIQCSYTWTLQYVQFCTVKCRQLTTVTVTNVPFQAPRSYRQPHKSMIFSSHHRL